MLADRRRRGEGVRELGRDDVEIPIPCAQRRHTVHQRGVHTLAQATSLALVERGADSRQQLLTRPVAAIRHRDVSGSFAAHHRLRRPQCTDAGHNECFVALDVGVGPCTAEPGDRTEDQPRVGNGQIFEAHPEALHHTGTEGLDEHVRPQRQSASQSSVIGVLQVEDQRLLPAPDHRERRQVSEQAPSRRLDVYNLGSEVGQRLARLCTREAARQIEHAETGERPSGRRRVMVIHQRLPGSDSPSDQSGPLEYTELAQEAK